MDDNLDRAMDDLRALPPEKQEQALRYVHSLRVQSIAEREAILDRAFGGLSVEDAAEWEAATLECRKIDVESW